MDRTEVIKSLYNAFEDKEEDKRFTIESKQIDKHNYLTLIAEGGEIITTHPDYDAFINLLKFQNTRDLNYVATILNQNKKIIFTELSNTDKENFLNEIRDMHQKLLCANSKNIVLIEYMIVDWANELFVKKQAI